MIALIAAFFLTILILWIMYFETNTKKCNHNWKYVVPYLICIKCWRSER